MRYASRTTKAIELIGGRKVLAKLMAKAKHCSNPTRTIETWMERQQVSRDGIDFIWQVAVDRELIVGPEDMKVIDLDDAQTDEAEDAQINEVEAA